MKIKIIKWLEGAFGALSNGVLEFKETSTLREKKDKTIWIREISVNLQIQNFEWKTLKRDLVKGWKKDIENLMDEGGELIDFHAELSDIYHSRADLPSKNAKSFLLMIQAKEETEVV